MPATRTITVSAALGFLTMGVATGCSGIRNRLEDGALRDNTVTEVSIDGSHGGGDITVRPDSSVKGVDIRRTVHYLGSAPSFESGVSITGTVLTLKTDCGTQCDVSYQVRVPAGVKVTGEIGSGDLDLRSVSDVDVVLGAGDVTLDGVTGSVRIENGSGDVRVSDVSGAVTVTSGSGDFTGKNLRGPTTSIDLASGDVTLDVPGTGDVKAVTGSGDIHLAVPDNTSRVTAHSDSGDSKIEVAVDSSSPRLIDLSTSSGDVTVKPRL